jgi:hypothetical protein
MVVDRDEQHFPAGTFDRISSISSHPMAGSLDSTQLLGVDVQHVARRGVFVANDWFLVWSFKGPDQPRVGFIPGGVEDYVR